MEKYRAEQIRNIVLLSHNNAGKTTLCENMLFQAKAIPRLGRIEDGTTTSDYEPEETKRKISINLSLLPLEWNKTKVNLIDTPGYSDFVGEVKASLRAADGAVIVVSAAAGVEVGTELTWKYAEERGLPRLMFVNKIDRENADFFKTVEQIQSQFGRKCVAAQLPIGAESSFEGVFDLISVKGAKAPPSIADKVNKFHEKLVEAVAETDDNLITKYLEGTELTEEEIRSALRAATLAGKLVPILAGSALRNKGITELLNTICNYLPSPKDRGKFKAKNPQSQKEEEIEPDEAAPFAALVFKTTADPYVGKLTYLRVFSGAINSDSTVWNATRNRAERIGQLYTVRGKTQEAVPRIPAGDIGAVAKLAETNTGDTLCNKDKPLVLPPIEFPLPTLSVAVHPKTKADLDKLGSSLTRLCEEDPTLAIRKDADTAETVLSGMGDTHFDVSAEKMKRKFGVEVRIETPKIPYRETITIPVKSEYKHKKQTGGHGQYGHVWLRLEPLPRGSGTEFGEEIVGGAVPRNYIPAVEKGVNEAVKEGVLAGYPITDMKITLFDGSFHAVDSSEISFKIAASYAIKKGMTQGNPVLLEPIMNLHITIPDNFTGDVMSDLNSKRARVLGMSPGDGINVIDAQGPLSELQKYAIDLRAITQGRGTYTMEFSHYEQVPAHVTQKIIAESKKEPEKA
jgi:elongation factor G